MYQPLAERVRPQSLDDLIGQEKITGPQAPLCLLVAQGSIPSMILYGNPGTGKTTLAKILSKTLNQPFIALNATSCSVTELKKILLQETEKQKGLLAKPPIVFIDEIHHFNKLQQDVLLHAVEHGTITLIGATSENPLFEINNALRSRCQIFKLAPLSDEALIKVLQHAMEKDVLLSKRNIVLEQTQALLSIASGDARRLLNTFEVVVNITYQDPVIITDQLVRDAIDARGTHDKSATAHYDVVSAFIKSIRGSDPNAAVYWLARMLEGGEPPRFVARRLIISASEDIGNANPTALVIANNAFQAVHVIGMPEARIILSQATIYLATSEKSNACYEAINAAERLVKAHRSYPVPSHIQNSPQPKAVGQVEKDAYLYAHDYPGNFVVQDYFPEELTGSMLYKPQNNPKELQIRKSLKGKWGKHYNYCIILHSWVLKQNMTSKVFI